jgi:hypothetical protein
MKKIIFLSSIIMVIATQLLMAQNNLPYLGQDPPGMTVKRFPPDSLLANNSSWWHGSPVFTPDGLEMFWTEYVKYSPTVENATLFTMKVENGNWSSIQHPSFGITGYFENSPVFSVTGDTLYFFSLRPGGPFFMVKRLAGGWSQPIALQIPVPNGMSFGLQLAVNRFRDVYLELSSQANPQPDIYVSRFQDGVYQMAQKLEYQINTTDSEWAPFIDPDDKYLIFSSNRPGMIGLQFDLYISYRNEDLSWTEPINMGSDINYSGGYFPSVSLDKQFLFFNTARPGDLGYNAYWISAAVIDSLRNTTGIQQHNQPKQLLKMFPNEPNPFKDKTTISFELGSATKLSIEVYNISGIPVRSIARDKMYPKGISSFTFNTLWLKPGTYTCVLTTESGNTLSQKMLIVK